jgi:predicted DNA-binding antitoxin AbrB/MazE fold protein
MIKAIYHNNVFRPLDPVHLNDGDEVELEIHEKSKIKQMVGAIKISDLDIIEDIIESDIYE